MCPPPMEAASTAAVRRNAAEVATLEGFHSWMFNTHRCYAVARQHENHDPGLISEVDAQALKSY